MGAMGWPSESELNIIRTKVAEMSGRDSKEVRVVVSPYRICPLGAHIDHQGGIVAAMTINKGILLGFVPSNDSQVILQSGQFKGEVRFSVDEVQLPGNTFNTKEESNWGNYARGALYALHKRGNHIKQGIIGFICGAEGLDSSGLSSSAAVGVAYLLAFESTNKLMISPAENIEYDRLIENEYLGLKNGILDQSAILLSSYGCLTCMNCKCFTDAEYATLHALLLHNFLSQTKEHRLVSSPELNRNHFDGTKKQFNILLAFSGLKQALITNPGYNYRVAECQEAARVLLQASGNEGLEAVLSNVEPEAYEEHKCKLDPNLAKRAEHYFSENKRVVKAVEAWARGNMEDYGKLISASGLSSIQNYESGCEPLIQLYEIVVKAPGVYGARFSGAGFRGCCIAFVDADHALDAASFVWREYSKVQPKLSSQMDEESMVLICNAGDCARVI